MSVVQSKRAFRFMLSLIACAAALIVASPAWAEEPFSIEPAKPKPSAYLPQSIVDSLDPHGSLLFTESNGLKERICEVFWAKLVSPRSGAPPSSKLHYGNFQPGALLGVIHFLPEASEDYREDFHDQKLKPGYYTMRYAIMPNGIGEHGPEPGDFVLLSSVRKDHDPQRVLPPAELIRLSRLASHTQDPAIMSLVPVEKNSATYPEVRTDDAGTCVLQVKVRLKAEKRNPTQDVAVGIILVTPQKEKEGS